MVPGAYNTYIRLKIGSVVFDYNDTEHMINLDAIRQIDNNCLNFVIELFDESAIELEQVILLSDANRDICIQYGYAEDATRRSPEWKGIVTKITPKFDTNGEMLTIEGTAQIEHSSYVGAVDKTYEGKPSEVFQQVAEEEGWTVVTCVETKDMVGDAYTLTEQKWSVSRPSYMTAHQFIEKEVIPYAVSTEGKGSYQLILEPYTNETLAYFAPVEDVKTITESYTITVGRPNNTVISFSPNYNYLTDYMGRSGVRVDAVDSLTGESITAYTGKTDYRSHVPSDVAQILEERDTSIVVTSKQTTRDAIENQAINVFEAASRESCTADLTIVGDPNILPGRFINIDVVTHHGDIHPTSGVYQILSVEDLVDKGAFKTILSLQKYEGATMAGGGAIRMVKKSVSDRANGTLGGSVGSLPISNYKPGESLGEFRITCYCPCQKCCGSYSYEVTGVMNKTGLTGDVPSEGRTIAVDPSIIPAGTLVTWNDPKLGWVVRRAEDKGGAIGGKHIDLYFQDHQAALKHGTVYAEVFIAEADITATKEPVVIPGAVPRNYVFKACEKYFGLPYVWGAKGPNAFDCSGFTEQVIRDLGGNAPRGSAAQRRGGTKVNSMADAKPGDLLFPSHAHVVIYLGNGYVAAAPHTGDIVKVQQLYFTPTDIRRYI